MTGSSDAGADADDHGALRVAVGGSDVDRPRADGVFLTLENERFEVEGEAGGRALDAARRNGRGDQAPDPGARRHDHSLPDLDVFGEPGPDEVP